MADFCKTCKHCDTWEYDEPCFSCRNTGGGIPTKWEAKVNCKTQTNADRIRAMSDEELAVFLRTVEYDVEQFPFVQDWDKWLKQPAKENDNA